MKQILAISAIALSVALSAAPAFAADENNTAPGLTAAGAPLGLHGVDPVAFIEIGNRVEGRAEYTAVHDGVAYYFSTEANMRKFKRKAADYTPQNGGFCTFGVSVGKKFDGDPQFADVRDGKLFVFLNEEIYNAYQKDKAGTISKADTQWTKIIHTAATDL
ncbi:MAG: YHS domain-containing (seleno)protein [Henriciella sp.]